VRSRGRDRAAAGAGTRVVVAPKPLEHSPGCFRREAVSVVLHGDDDVVEVLFDDHGDRAVRTGMADGVREQVEENAFDLVGSEVGASRLDSRSGNVYGRTLRKRFR
jgi:hypothetical protein